MGLGREGRRWRGAGGGWNGKESYGMGGSCLEWREIGSGTHQIPDLFLGLIRLHGSMQICATGITGTDPGWPIVAARSYPRAKWLFPCPRIPPAAKNLLWDTVWWHQHCCIATQQLSFDWAIGCMFLESLLTPHWLLSPTTPAMKQW